MPVFTRALRLIFRRPVALVIFIGLFGALGLLMVTDPDAAQGQNQSLPQEVMRPAAVLDRDQSALSQELTAFLGQRAELIDLADDPRTVQDAVAQNRAAYILIIPPGYGQDFLEAVRQGDEPPAVESVVSYEAASGILLDQVTTSFLNAARLTALSQPTLSETELVKQASVMAAESAPVEVVQADQALSAADSLPYFFKWGAFPLCQGLIVLVALAFADFQTGEVRRRNLASPLRPVSMNLQITAACLTLIGLSWLYLCLLSLVPAVGGLSLLASDPARAGLLGLALLIFSAVPLAIGFLISQFHLSENAVMACAITISLALMFLSGIFLGTDGAELFSPAIQAVAGFTPVYWFSESINAAVDATNWSWSSLAPYVSSLAVVVLFALAIFSVGLVVARLNVQTATAGGNTVVEGV